MHKEQTFNKGHNNGAGNPPGDNETYRTVYLWREVFQTDSLLEILARFLHIEIKEIKIPTARGIKFQKKETLIFPRYHQLDVVRKLIAHTKEYKSGHNYLIQHSAGSGKSNSIAWLAHRLANLHDEQDEKIFHTVIVITDRIDTLNQRFGTDFTPADQLFFDQIAEQAIINEAMKQAARVNTKENFAPVLDKHLENLFIDRMEGNEKIFMEVMNNEALRKLVFQELLSRVYSKLNDSVN